MDLFAGYSCGAVLSFSPMSGICELYMQNIFLAQMQIAVSNNELCQLLILIKTFHLIPCRI